MKRILVLFFAALISFAFTTGTLIPMSASAAEKKGDAKSKKMADEKEKEAEKKFKEDKAKAKAGGVKTEKPKKDTKPLTPAEVGG